MSSVPPARSTRHGALENIFMRMSSLSRKDGGHDQYNEMGSLRACNLMPVQGILYVYAPKAINRGRRCHWARRTRSFCLSICSNFLETIREGYQETHSRGRLAARSAKMAR